MAEARGSILISTANKIGATLVKKLGGTGYTPSEWADKINLLGALPEDTVSGDIANFPDGAEDVPVVELISNIAPTQAGSGDPAPDNVRAISGYTGMNISKQRKNLIQAPEYANNTPTLCLDLGRDVSFSSIAVSFLATNAVATSTGAALFDFRKDDETHQYRTLASFKDDNNVSFAANVAQNGRFKIIAPNITFRYIYIYYMESSFSYFATDCISEWQVEIGSTATDYEPYAAPEVKSISWETEAGTVYGGSLNVTTGELTITYGMVKISDLTWQKQTASGRDFFLANISDQESTNTHDILCDNIAYSGMVTVTAMTDKSIAKWQQSVRIYDTDIADVTALLNTYGNGNILFYYKDISKIVIQLDPVEVNTLLGVNNIYNDTNGDTEVNYRADTDLYIAKKLAE